MAFIELPILGIDISKAKFDVALLVYGKVKKSRVFENNLVGFKALSLWLVKQDITHLFSAAGKLTANELSEKRTELKKLFLLYNRDFYQFKTRNYISRELLQRRNLQIDKYGMWRILDKKDH